MQSAHRSVHARHRREDRRRVRQVRRGFRQGGGVFLPLLRKGDRRRSDTLRPDRRKEVFGGAGEKVRGEAARKEAGKARGKRGNNH